MRDVSIPGFWHQWGGPGPSSHPRDNGILTLSKFQPFFPVPVSWHWGVLLDHLKSNISASPRFGISFFLLSNIVWMSPPTDLVRTAHLDNGLSLPSCALCMWTLEQAASAEAIVSLLFQLLSSSSLSLYRKQILQEKCQV